MKRTTRDEPGLRTIAARVEKILDGGIARLRHRLKQLEAERQMLHDQTTALKAMLHAWEAELGKSRSSGGGPVGRRRRRTAAEVDADREQILNLVRRGGRSISIAEVRQHLPFATTNDMMKLVESGDLKMSGSKSGARYSAAGGRKPRR